MAHNTLAAIKSMLLEYEDFDSEKAVRMIEAVSAHSMRTPDKFIADFIPHCEEKEIQTGKNNKKYFLVRPDRKLGLLLIKRLRLAIGVFTGKYDAVFWKIDRTP